MWSQTHLLYRVKQVEWKESGKSGADVETQFSERFWSLKLASHFIDTSQFVNVSKILKDVELCMGKSIVVCVLFGALGYW